jgi:hypothetical protein
MRLCSSSRFAQQTIRTCLSFGMAASISKLARKRVPTAGVSGMRCEIAALPIVGYQAAAPHAGKMFTGIM